MRAVLVVLAVVLAAGAAQPASQIQLVGNISRKCTLDVAPNPNSTNLDLTASGAQRILIAAVTQDCNGHVDFVLQVFSANCVAAPLGAKLVDPMSGEFLPYTLESENPVTGGSAPLVTGLLGGACINQVARQVDHGRVRDEVSDFYVRYTGSPTLEAGTYQDTLTVTLTVN